MLYSANKILDWIFKIDAHPPRSVGISYFFIEEDRRREIEQTVAQAITDKSVFLPFSLERKEKKMETKVGFVKERKSVVPPSFFEAFLLPRTIFRRFPYWRKIWTKGFSLSLKIFISPVGKRNQVV